MSFTSRSTEDTFLGASRLTTSRSTVPELVAVELERDERQRNAERAGAGHHLVYLFRTPPADTMTPDHPDGKDGQGARAEFASSSFA